MYFLRQIYGNGIGFQRSLVGIRKCYGKPVGAYNELGSGGALEIKIDIQNDTHRIYI